jgi:hypothetical protein
MSQVSRPCDWCLQCMECRQALQSPPGSLERAVSTPDRPMMPIGIPGRKGDDSVERLLCWTKRRRLRLLFDRQSQSQCVSHAPANIPSALSPPCMTRVGGTKGNFCGIRDAGSECLWQAGERAAVPAAQFHTRQSITHCIHIASCRDVL